MEQIKLQDVEWKTVFGYEGFYEVSSHGEVRSVDRMELCRGVIRTRKGRTIKTAIRTEYFAVHLSKNGIAKMKRVNILVGKAFIDNPGNKGMVNHKDGNKLNNHYLNLEWVTAKENKHHAIYVLKAYSHGVNHHDAKLNDSIIRSVRKQFIDNPNINKAKLARDNGIQKGNLNRILSGKSWRHVV